MEKKFYKGQRVSIKLKETGYIICGIILGKIEDSDLWVIISYTPVSCHNYIFKEESITPLED